MLRRTPPSLVTAALALGALASMCVPSLADDPVEQAWRSASPVQGYTVTPSNRMPGTAGAPIQLLNDPSTEGEVHFLVDGRQSTLKAGEMLELDGGPHVVEFNSGGDYGDLRFTLYQGLYKFKVMPEGWGLFKSSSQPSVAGRAPAADSRSQAQRGYSPPLPAEDLRTRRMAGRTNDNPAGRTDGNPSTGGRPVNPPLPPSASTGAGQDTTRSISAPPPAGINRPRTDASQTP